MCKNFNRKSNTVLSLRISIARDLYLFSPCTPSPTIINCIMMSLYTPKSRENDIYFT